MSEPNRPPADPTDPAYRLRPMTLVGLILWRGGLGLAGGYGAFRLARWVIRYVDLPLQLEVGAALVVAGGLLIFGTVVAERLMDLEAEKAERSAAGTRDSKAGKGAR